jgi:beta-fructofuranosidase
VATGSADLRTWAREPANPVIRETPPGVDVPAFRDHCVWREDGTWRQLVGSGITGRGGAALLYESPDLREWRYIGPLVVGNSAVGVEGDADWTGTMWECVDLFRPPTAANGPGPQHVLVFSAWHDGTTHHPLYLTGDYAGDSFTPSAAHRLDLGGRYFYAPQSFSDDRGRRILFGWLQEGRPEAEALANGWSGVMSLPRQAVLGADGELHLSPVDEVASLRGAPQAAPGRDLSLGEPVELAGGDQLDVELALVLEPGARVEVRVRATDDAAESTVLEIGRNADGPGGTVRLDRSRSSLDPAVDGTERSGPVPVDADGAVAVRLIVDHSALEVFVNGRALTARVYPTRADATGCAVVLVDGPAGLVEGTSWPMRDVWERGRVPWPRA